MALWRRQAADLLPELWGDEDNRDTLHLFFFAVLPFVRDAHREGDDEKLDRAYRFAKWCLRQGGGLRNAAGVAFYEHLFDSWDVRDGVARQLDLEVVGEVWELWEARLTDEQLAYLRAELR